ncbi:MAG: indole-3-glycerol-phosphate synthase [Proteobacteria bacterium]|nr:indole-3-glycerol-phosphate synthase [Pseudomonadota bacterium]
MSGFLEEMAAASTARLLAAKALHAEGELQRRAQDRVPAPRLRLRGFDLIAELKLRSPAAGALRGRDEDLGARVSAYARGGAAAVSVLTEPSRFDGALEHLELAARALAPLDVPAMRKDFLVDPYQVLEARAAGAGGVLVILRMLSAAQIDALLDCARGLGMFVLLEAFDAADIARMHDLVQAHAAHLQLLAGVNCRDLDTLQVVPARLLELLPLLPRQVPRVAESGVASEEDARRVAGAGYELALIGSALMRGGDPQGLVRSLLAAGRDA